MQMQQLIRAQGSEAMDPEQYKKFIELHEGGQLQKPEVWVPAIIQPPDPKWL